MIVWIASVCQRYLLLQDTIVTVQPDLCLHLITRNGNILILVIESYLFVVYEYF